MTFNNLQWLIYHKTQPNQIIYIQYICIKRNTIKPNQTIPKLKKHPILNIISKSNSSTKSIKSVLRQDWLILSLSMKSIILCPEVRESYLLYVQIYIFCQIVSKIFFFFHQVLLNMNKTDGTLSIPLSQSRPGSNGNEGVLQTFQIFRSGASPSDAV